MGRASTYSEGEDSPHTRCPSCRTVFEVSAELLSSSDTRVRCGECLSIFDALANLRDPDHDAEHPKDVPAKADGAEELETVFPETTDDTGELDVTYADFDLFSGEAELPEVAYLDDTADTAEFDFDAVDPDEDETFSDTLFAHDATIDARDADGSYPGELDAGGEGDPAGSGVDSPDAPIDEVPEFLVDETPGEPLAFEYRDAGEPDTDEPPGETSPGAGPSDAVAASDPLPASPGGGGSWWLRVSMGLVLGALLAGLFVYRERERLHNDPLLRPLLVIACRALDCEVPSRVALDSLKLLGKEVFTHPKVEGALVINVAFRNTADFAQRYPTLVVRLRDRLGRSVAERDFAPGDYLDDWTAGDTLAAGRRLDISLEVSDPGRGAESYEFEFREASG